MRVLYYCPEYYFTHGGRTHARGFFGALGKLPEVEACFLFPEREPARAPVDPGGQSRGARRERLWFLPQTWRQVVRCFAPRPALTRAVIAAIKAKRCDALVIRTGTGRPSIRGIRRACPGVPVCAEVNSALFDEGFHGLALRPLFQRWEVRRFNQADGVTVVSSDLKQYLQKQGVPAEKILVNQNGVDLTALETAGPDRVREQYGIPVSAFVIGYVGGMETFRRLPEVVGQIAELRRAGHDDIYLLMVGDGTDMLAVKAAIEANRAVLGDAVKLAGWRDHGEIPQYLASFDIALFPFTNAYCSPLKLFEYLGAGLATIGPDTPAVREVFEDGVHLRLAKQDGSDLAAIVQELKASPELRQSLAQRGREMVAAGYTWRQNAERVVAHIRQVRGQQ